MYVLSSQFKYTDVTVSGNGHSLCVFSYGFLCVYSMFSYPDILLLFHKSLILTHCDVEISAPAE